MGTVHAGLQLRWFEQLCRIQVQRLRSVVTPRGGRIVSGTLPGSGGVYCFWWTGDLKPLDPPACNRHMEVVSPGGRVVPLEFDDEWLGVKAGLPIPPYVGKNADSIAARVAGHLMLGKDRVTPLFEERRKQRRPTISCQARAGVEHLFPRMPKTRDLMLDNVGLSWVALDGDDHAANRFFLEDLAIGLMRPILNVDVER